MEFARTIHGAGTDLLNLITDILDLSKIESGTVTVETRGGLLRQPARHGGADRSATRPRPAGCPSTSQLDPRLARSIVTDPKRLQQVLKNLLSNAFKFTEQGGVRLKVSLRRGRLEHRTTRSSSRAPAVVAFEVSDTGIGIPPEKQRIIFEAFQQADAGTSRKYGGTGLGLAISRELANLLGGEIQLRSTPGVGSTFTLYLPLRYAGPSTAARARARPTASERASAPAVAGVRCTRASGRAVPDDRDDLGARRDHAC